MTCCEKTCGDGAGNSSENEGSEALERVQFRMVQTAVVKNSPVRNRIVHMLRF